MNRPLLQPGDTIGVMAPSSYVEREDIERSAKLLEERGYKVFIHPQTYEREHQSAGNHLQKSLAFQGLWMRDDIQAIWAAGGGNRALHLLGTINFEKLKGKPKALIGFSDVTALLNAVYAHTGIQTYHGPVFKNLHTYAQLDHCLDLLAGKDITYPADAINIIRAGQAEGHLIGGNLSLFQYLPALLPDQLLENSILFLEECNEDLSKIDRMLAYLKQCGVFDSIKALIFGEFTNIQDTGRPFGYSLEDIIQEHTQTLDIPVIMQAPFGHGERLYTLPIGAMAKIDTEKTPLLAL